MTAAMTLTKFRVWNFRSVEDSGWIAADDVTALIGINESGKTNLLLPLWKLNPAKDGEINLVADAPRKRYSEIKDLEEKPVFIEAHFELPDHLIDQLVALTGAAPEGVRIASVSRKLDGMYLIGFPDAEIVRTVPKDELIPVLEQARADIQELEPASKAEDGFKEVMDAAVVEAIGLASRSTNDVTQNDLKSIAEELSQVDLEGAAKRSTLAPRFGQLVDSLDELVARASRPAPSSVSEARKLVLNSVPSFVYYSNYGNLDSEIYLPHVIENLERDDLGSRETAKARTLKVLFEFVKLKAEEILELGQDLPRSDDDQDEEPSEEEIKAVAERKKEREILLQSASTDLTQKFRDWWKQGDYRIRFNADGDHFRI